MEILLKRFTKGVSKYKESAICWELNAKGFEGEVIWEKEKRIFYDGKYLIRTGKNILAILWKFFFFDLGGSFFKF